MRNILEHPITNEEIIQTLQRMQDNFGKDIDGPVGSMDGIILEVVEQRLTYTVNILETMIGSVEDSTIIHLLKEIHDVKS